VLTGLKSQPAQGDLSNFAESVTQEASKQTAHRIRVQEWFRISVIIHEKGQ